MKTAIKISLCAILAALPTQYALAEAYTGLTVGYGMTTIEKKVLYNGTENELSDHYNSARAQILLGYNFRNYRHDVFLEEGASSSEFYFAVEAAVTYVTSQAKESIENWFLSADAEVSEKLRYQADLFVLAKYILQPSTTIFIGPGVTVGHFELSTPGVTAGNLGVTGSETTTVSGLAFKAGVDVEICEGINLLAAYQYSSYETTNFSGDEPLTGDSVTAKYKPMVSALSLGVIFH